MGKREEFLTTGYAVFEKSCPRVSSDWLKTFIDSRPIFVLVEQVWSTYSRGRTEIHLADSLPQRGARFSQRENQIETVHERRPTDLGPTLSAFRLVGFYTSSKKIHGQ